jgi:hypothetical protein
MPRRCFAASRPEDAAQQGAAADEARRAPIGRWYRLAADVDASSEPPRRYGLRGLLRRLEFDERVRGSHHIFTKTGVEEILNLQLKGRNAKSYQVKQVRAVIVKYRLAGGANGP